MANDSYRIRPEFIPGDPHALAGVHADGHFIPCGPGFPLFDILLPDGSRAGIPPDHPGLACSFSQPDESTLSVVYELPGMFSALVRYDLQADGMEIVTEILSESGARMVSVRSAGFTLSPDSAGPDFKGIVIPEFSGRLLTFASTPCADHDEILQSAKYLADFFAMSYPDAGMIVRPMHFSAAFTYGVGPERLHAGAVQFFRPEKTENFLTPLCHTSLALRMALVTGRPCPQDWRDIALYYRRHFIPANTAKHPWYRDAVTSGAPLHGHFSDFADYLPVAARLDYADIALWVVCGHCPKTVNLDHLYWDFIPDPGRGDYLKFKKAAALYDWKTSIHQDMDLVTVGRGWDEQYVRRRPNGDLYQDGEWGGRKSYFRSFLGFRDQWPGFIDDVFDRWDVRPGDLWHDDVNGWFYWEDYNTDHPSTRHIDREIRREIWTYCRDKRGVSMSDECLMEGMTDLNDYSHWTFCYESDVNDRIMMMPLLFLGSTYYAFSCIEATPSRDLRLPPVNFAYSLLAGVKFGITVTGPDDDLYCEPYFKNNLMWSFIADAFVETLENQDGIWHVAYSNGVTLSADPAANDFTMTIGGIDYHHYTPVNHKGYMALWASGTYRIAPGIPAPFRTRLWQSHGEGAISGVTTRIDPDGAVSVTAETTVSEMPGDTRRYMRASQGNGNMDYIDTPDLLVLQRIPAAMRCADTVWMTEIASPENEYRFALDIAAGTMVSVEMLSGGWGVRLYTSELGKAVWERKLEFCSAGHEILSFQPYVYGDRGDLPLSADDRSARDE